MNAATIIKHHRNDLISYCERFGDSLREASVGYKETGFQFGLAGFIFGWNRKIVLYQKTLTGWARQNQNLPFTDNDWQHVLEQIAVILSHQGYRVKIETGERNTPPNF